MIVRYFWSGWSVERLKYERYEKINSLKTYLKITLYFLLLLPPRRQTGLILVQKKEKAERTKQNMDEQHVPINFWM